MLFRDITLNEVLDLLEDVNDACDLYIEPSDVADLTDEDSGDKEKFTMANLTGSQLGSSAEIQFRTQRDESFVERAETSNQSSSQTAGPSRKKKKIFQPYQIFNGSPIKVTQKIPQYFPSSITADTETLVLVKCLNFF